MRVFAIVTSAVVFFALNGAADVLDEAAAAATALAEEKVAAAEVEEDAVAVTNWTDGYIEVTAVGAANLTLSQSQAHALSQAEETARALAYRKLSERVYGVQINSRVAVRGAVAADDTLVAVTGGLIRDAHEVKVTHEVLDDGSVLCAVTLSMPMTTAQGLVALASRVPPANGDAPIYNPGTTGAAAEGYTGVIIDAADLGAAPALTPTLLTEDGHVVYGAETTAPERVSALGLTPYARTLAQAQAKGAGSRPLVIRALRAVGEYACDLVLPSDLVDILFQLNKDKDVFAKGRLVIMTRGVE